MTLQEYLVKLGWQVDEPSFKKFAGAVASTTARTAELSSALLETVGAVELMVSQVARKYETLYYVGQRTQQSVKYIQSTQFAFRGIGLSADDANASIERIGATLRTQPWLKAIFGNATTPQEIASKLGKSGLPYFLQTRFAEMIGMDETTLLHLQKFADIEASAGANFARRQREAGIDPEKLARDSASFGRELNQLESDLDIFGERMAKDFLDPTVKAVHYMDEAVQWINRVDEATKGWTGTIMTLAGTAGGLLVFEKVLRRVLGLGSKTATGATLGLGAKAARGLSLGTGSWLGAVLAGLEVVKTNDPSTKKALRGALGPVFYELGLSKSPDLNDGSPATRRYHRIGKLGATPAGDPEHFKGVGNRNDRVDNVVQALVKAGYPLASAQGIAAGLYSESGLKTNNPNPTSGMNGIGQWDKARSAEFQKQYLHPVGEGTMEEQIQFLLWELNNTEKKTGDKLRKGGLTPRGAAGEFIAGYERPGAAGVASDMNTAGPLADQLGAAAAGNVDSSKTITLNNKVDVHMPPGGDVFGATKAFTGALDQSTANAVRNLNAVTR